MIEVVLVTCDADWQALYIDNVIEIQGHTIGAFNALRKVSRLNKPFLFRSLHEYEFEYLEFHGEFPPYLTDLKEYTDND